MEQIYSAYVESFNKQDAASLAALYATGAIIVDPAGPHHGYRQGLRGHLSQGGK